MLLAELYADIRRAGMLSRLRRVWACERFGISCRYEKGLSLVPRCYGRSVLSWRGTRRVRVPVNLMPLALTKRQR